MSATDWKQTRLGKELELLYGKGLPASARIAGDVPVFGSNGIVGFHDKPLVEGPGIIVGRKGSVGEVAFSDRPFWPIDTTYYVSNRGGNNWRFLYFLLQHLQLTGLNSHSTVPGLNRESVYSIESAFPPKTEQEKIAAVLWKIQKAIEIEGAIVREARDLKKSLLHRFFSHGLRGEPLKETEIGPLPESWDVSTVGQTCHKPQYGFTTSAKMEAVGPKFLRITDITEQGVSWDIVPFCECNEKDFSTYSLNHDDIVFARIGATTGKSFIVKNPPRAVFASYLIRVRPRSGVVPDFLYYFFQTPAYWAQVNANKDNNLKGGVNGSILSAMFCPIPGEDEQREIADVLQTVDRKIDIHESKNSSLRDLFKTMLQKLMGAKIRVNDLDIDTSEVNR